MSSAIRNLRLSVITYGSQIISGSVVYIVLAGILSVGDFGLLAFGITLSGLLTVTSEFGYALMAERDMAMKKYPQPEYVYSALLHKLFFSGLSAAGGLMYLLFLYAGDNVSVGIIFMINAVITSYNVFFLSLFRANNKYRVESIITLLYAVFLCCVLALALATGLSVISIAWLMLAGRFLQLILLFTIYTRTYGRPSKPAGNDIHRYFLKNSYSFGAHYIIGIFYFSVDSQLIAYYSGNDSLAIYQSLFRIVMILLSVSDLLNNVFLPWLSSKFRSDKVDFERITQAANRIVIVLGLALFLFLNLFAPAIVSLLYGGKYDAALKIVLPLSFVLLFRIFCSVYAILLTISDHQNVRVLVVLVSLVVNISLNLWLIPLYGYTGAAWVSLITHMVLATLYALFSSRYLRSLYIDARAVAMAVLTIGLVVLMAYTGIRLSLPAGLAVMLAWVLMALVATGRSEISRIAVIFRGGFR